MNHNFFIESCWLAKALRTPRGRSLWQRIKDWIARTQLARPVPVGGE